MEHTGERVSTTLAANSAEMMGAKKSEGEEKATREGKERSADQDLLSLSLESLIVKEEEAEEAKKRGEESSAASAAALKKEEERKKEEAALLKVQEVAFFIKSTGVSTEKKNEEVEVAKWADEESDLGRKAAAVARQKEEEKVKEKEREKEKEQEEEKSAEAAAEALEFSVNDMLKVP
jgi:hypothetical protein